MNLNKEDFESLKLNESIQAAKNLWIDSDYTSELEYKRVIIKSLEDTKEYLSRYFDPNH